MIKINSKVSEYISKKGTPTLVYNLTGDKEELEQYKQDRLEVVSSEETASLFFSTRTLNTGDEVMKTSSGRYVIKQNLAEQMKKQEELQQVEEAKLQALMKVTGMSAEDMVSLMLK